MKKTILFIFCLMFEAFVFGQKNRLDTLATIINNKNIPIEKIRNILYESPAYQRFNYTVAEVSQLKSILLKRYSGKLTLDQDYEITLILKECLSGSKLIGQALMAIENHVKLIQKTGNKKALAKAYNLYIGVYVDLNDPKKQIEYARKHFYLLYPYEKDPLIRAAYEEGYGWHLTLVGRQLNNNTYLDSCVILYKKALAYRLKRYDDVNALRNDYGILMLTLARLGRYNEVLETGRKAIKVQYEFPDKSPEGRKVRLQEVLDDYTLRMADAFVQMNNRDSAFYYYNLPVGFKFDKTPKDTWHPHIKKYYTFNRMMAMAEAHIEFGEYKQAAELYDEAMFGKNHLGDSTMIEYLYSKSAGVFAKAGLKDKAIFCYSHARVIEEKWQKEQNKLFEEARHTTTTMQVEAAQEKSLLEKEKIQLQVSDEKKSKQLIIWISIAGTGLLLAFLGFVYNRFRVTRKQKNIIELQKKLVEEKQKEVMDSIHYAKRIQQALLPTEKSIDKKLNDLKKS